MMKAIRSNRISLALAALMAVTTMVAPVSAAPSLNLGAGQTTVVLSSDFIGALGALGLSAGSVGEGSLRSGIASFPITGGVIDLGTAKAEINHSGGLFLAAGGNRVELTSFNIDTTGSSAVLTGLVTVNGDLLGRVPLFDLTLPSLTLPLRPQSFQTLFVPNVRVTLTAAAAGALSGVFGATVPAGLNIGTASVYAVGDGGGRPSFFGRTIR
ncbi:MAG: hypothetical protein IPM66_08425 [Acidobacteriota bacterium]|nr:MAG: hypothetical protein IPM66_08425 [Acidobacteriota bacterium]